jgi:titin
LSIVAPSPPVGPIEFSNITCTSVTVTWQPPEDDGGAKVKEYILEAKEVTRASWTKVATVSSVSTSYDAEKLKDKQEYLFRVSAVNSVGQSEPLVSDKVQLTSPYGKLHVVI